MRDGNLGRALDRDWRRAVFSDELVTTIDRWAGIHAHADPVNRRKVGIRIFRYDPVEATLSKAHPVVPVLWAGPFVLWGLHRGFVAGHTTWSTTVGLFVAGLLVWTFTEYVLHRWIFHVRPRGFGGRTWSFLVHGYHHEFPDDGMRLVAPPLMVLVFGSVVVSVFVALLGPDRWLQAFAGFCTGYVAYDWIHYFTHHARPERGVGRWLKEYHLRHHFEDGGTRFGISSPFWDFVFGTYRGARRRG